MREITFQDPHRQKHFNLFNHMNHPHYCICVNVDITNLLSYLKTEEIMFTPAVVYLISRVANELPSFRQRIRGQKVIEHDQVNPSFSVQTKVSDVFSFCEVAYQASAPAFIAAAKVQMKKMEENPVFEDQERDDYLFLSSLPWISFTGLTHAMHYHPCDSVPRITWGKYFQEGDKVKMPLSLQVHHALVDGGHVGRYYIGWEELAANPSSWLS
ncbi:MAG: chloramphenicol acetyltransferase [Cyanothece sp. SIO1E1]|nr:chloramphenicol acetyltransferase [Cyanothece sp. SIO1E1]